MKKYTLFISLACFLIACHKKSDRIGIDGALYADFSFKPGSYWIYQDSTGGETDSMYVAQTSTQWGPKGCVFSSNAPQYETEIITIRKWSANANDSEIWNIFMTENRLSVDFVNSSDRVAGMMGFINLFTYPIQPGNAPNGNGCVVTADSGTIRNIGTFTAGSGGSYPYVVQNAHSAKYGISSAYSYNDCFYTSPTVGFVRMVFNHPADSVYRVLNLMRYKTIR